MVEGEEVLVFSDEFQTLDKSKWKPEVTLSGGGEWGMQWYRDDPSNLYVENGTLFLQPGYTADVIGERIGALLACSARMTGEIPYTIDLGESCTLDLHKGCRRTSNLKKRHILNPITSAMVSTKESFSFTYGRVEVVAKLPRGDWLWPAIWLASTDSVYGHWPRSGEIDLMESRGNPPTYGGAGYDKFGSTLHWGRNWKDDRYDMTHAETWSGAGDEATFVNDFHTYGLLWSELGISIYLDDVQNTLLDVPFNEPAWERGWFKKAGLTDEQNPWRGSSSDAAPFDAGFHIQLDVACGGLSGYFRNGDDKPWNSTDSDSLFKFWEARKQWQPSWNGKDSALQVRSVKVWQQVGKLNFTSKQGHKSQKEVLDNRQHWYHGCMALGLGLLLLLGAFVIILALRKRSRSGYREINR
ncbi:unnamed protein product [Chrysoparadoxa australica]